jgi:hypothetical protein
MTEPRNDDRSQARREAAALLNVDINDMSPADGLRVDMVSALRLVIDHEQANVLSGGSADLGKLNVAVQSLIALLPGRELPAPESQRDDHDAAVAPLLKLFRYLHESVHTLSAENARLKAQLAGGLPSASDGHSTGGGGSAVITPPTCDITPPGEIGDLAYAGPVRPGPDDPKPGRVIEGKVARSPAASAAPASRQQDWDSTPSGKAWNAWRDAGGYAGDPWANNNR